MPPSTIGCSRPKRGLRRRFSDWPRRWNAERAEAAAQEAQTTAQRRRIARHLRAQHAAQRKNIRRCHEEVEQLRRQCEALAASNRDLEARLADADVILHSSATDGGNTPSPHEDIQRRYELALDDLRELKARNAELQQQVERTRTSGGSGGDSGKPKRAGLDWEAEKRRIIAALESDFDDADFEDRTARLKIEEVVRTTDQAIAEKDREIAELRGLMETQGRDLVLATGNTAEVGQAIDLDEVVREERVKLQQLQEEYRGKLRQAEVELSLDRAKLARQRSELEEQRRAKEPQAESPRSATLAIPSRGKWLSRLGLADEEKK